MFGVSKRFNWLPSTPATRSTASCCPTTITRSPTWSIRFGSANRSIPERLIRVTFTPYILRKCRLPSFLPLISDLVTRIRRETIGRSCFSQSSSTSFPINTTIAGASSSEQTINNWSPILNTVSWSGILTWPSWRIREQTNLRPRKFLISISVFPLIDSLRTSRLIMWGLWCESPLWIFRLSSSFAILTRKM